MTDNPKSPASGTPLHDQLRRFIENVRAHPGDIGSNEYGITTPISWDGLGHAYHPLVVFEKMADALEAAAALRAPTIAVTDAEAADADSVEYANKVQSNLSSPDAFVWMIARNAYLAGRAALATPSPTIASAGISDETLASALLNEQELARLRAELWKAQHPNIEINEGKTNG